MCVHGLYGQNFHEINVRLCGSNNLLPLHQPDFPSCADEIFDPRPDMNIKLPPLE